MNAIGVVVRASPGRVWVRIPSTGQTETWGPCRIMAGPWTQTPVLSTAAANGPDVHIHAQTPRAAIAPGDQVLVVSVGDNTDEWVVVGPLEP